MQSKILAPACGEPAIDKLVYLEANVPVKKAERRVNEIMSFTRMQKDRLIRGRNLDWKDMRPELLALISEAKASVSRSALVA